MKGENQKLKMLYLVKIFMECTDDEHALTMQEIVEKLDYYGVSADRKTLYLDFAELEKYGIDVISQKTGRNTYYHIGSRLFELPELKLLVDSVQAAKFITDSKSQGLIKKLESLASTYEAGQLNRQVVIKGRVKTDNKMVFVNVDTIYTAIGANRQISFRYWQWDVHGRQVLRHDGALYRVSPWCLMWDDEYYYLVAFSAAEGIVKHFRVDKMKNLTVTEQTREGQEVFKEFNMAKYAKSVFGMFSGEETRVTLECRNDMAGVIIDRFGSDVTLFPQGDEHFTVHVSVVPSSQFLGWIFSLGSGVKITGPAAVVEKMRDETERMAEAYRKEK